MLGFIRPKTSWRCRRLKRRVDVADRQRRVPGFSQEAAAGARVLVVSAGGLGGGVVEGLTQKGYGTVHACDHDVVGTSDLNRQLFIPRHIGKPKATSLCENVSRRGFLGTELVAHTCMVQELDIAAMAPSVVFCGVDMQIVGTRPWLCRELHRLKIPGVFAAVSRDASWGYVFVQQPGAACWACAFKPEFESSVNEDSSRCPGTPAVIDVLKTIAGLSLHAIDSLLMPNRVRDWNFRRVSMTQRDFDAALQMERRAGCSVCGNAPSGVMR